MSKGGNDVEVVARMSNDQGEIITIVNVSRWEEAGSMLQSGTSDTQDELDPFVSSMGPAWDMVFAIILAIIISCGAFINVIVLCTLTKLRCRIHSTIDFYILSLAISDTLVLVTCYPFSLISTISHEWQFGTTGCIINGFLGFFFSFIDVGILCMMSVVRMLIVKLPYYTVVKRKSSTAALLIGVVSYALVFSLCPVFGWGEYAPEPFGTSCTINWTLPDKSYVTTVFIVVLVVPMIIMVCSYFSIVFHMKTNASRLDRHSTCNRRRNNGRQNKLIRMTLVMCLCFLLTWTPYSVVSICFAYVPGFQLGPVVSAVPTLLAKTSHIINPIVYFATNSTYRTRLQQFWYSKFQLSRSQDRKTTKATMTERTMKSGSSSSTGDQQPWTAPTPSSLPLVPLSLQAATSVLVCTPTSSEGVPTNGKSHKMVLLVAPQESHRMDNEDVLI